MKELEHEGIAKVVEMNGVGCEKFAQYVYDYINESRDKNPNHKYAMQPLVLKIGNVAGYTDFPNGLTPDIIKKESIFNDLGKIIINPELRRNNIDDITVADLTGTGVQDTAIARYAYAIANKKKLGTIVQ